MLTGRTSGQYAYHYEFRGVLRETIPGGRHFMMSVPLDVSPGLWFITVTATFGLRNLNVMAQILPDNPERRGAGAVHNHTASPTFGPVTVVGHWDNVRVRRGTATEVRVFCSAPGPRSGGELGERSLSIVAWKQTGVATGQGVGAGPRAPGRAASTRPGSKPVRRKPSSAKK